MRLCTKLKFRADNSANVGQSNAFHFSVIVHKVRTFSSKPRPGVLNSNAKIY
jgi:hypothetical protein